MRRRLKCLWLVGLGVAAGCAGNSLGELNGANTDGGAPQFCGNGVLNSDEKCDDGNQTSGDGCSDVCQIEAGWACPTPGAACVAACGDSIVTGIEQCDDGNAKPGDGCDAHCQFEAGYTCPTAGKPCSLDLCGNRQKEGGEQCDDGNHDFGDGCTPNCTLEPNCRTGACSSTCGDGFTLPGDPEECDDSNTRPGDGCSADCKVEKGYACPRELADIINLPVVIRDFKPSAASGGHIDFESVVSGLDLGIVAAQLGGDKKPVYASGTQGSTHGAAAFNQWYRDSAGVNLTFMRTLPLSKQANSSYIYDNSAFFPLDGVNGTFGNSGNDGNGKPHNFGFTTETHYWFEYRGGERLDFVGDDDVWFFINGRLGVDLGGVHPAVSGSITLSDSNASSFGLQKGKVYELSMFQAERHTTESNYKLTLYQFSKGRSTCASKCGDGIVSPDEACDDGKNDGSEGGCMPGCKARGPRCGDGVTQAAAGEQCDDGINTSKYGGCGPGCKLVSYCGDGHVDTEFGEQCDEGKAGTTFTSTQCGGGVDTTGPGGTCQVKGGNTGEYGHCSKDCKAGPRCGDGIVQPEFEQCDDGNTVDTDGCPNSCKYVKPPVG